MAFIHYPSRNRFALRAGFTLVELLVVIAVVVVLIAMLLPAVSKAKDRAREVFCRGNLRQNIIALNAYLQDSRDVLPTPWSSAWDGFPVVLDNGQAYNQGLLFPYLNYNASTLFCTDVVEAVPGSWKVFTDPKLGVRTFHANWRTKTVKTFTSYGMPRRWDDPDNPPTSSLMITGGPYDIFRTQQDIAGFVAINNKFNLPPLSKNGRYYPIMACLQQWSAGGSAAYGGHRAEMSNFAYSDGVVMPMYYNFRAAGVNQFASSATWALYTKLR